MNIPINKLLIVSFLSFSLCTGSGHKSSIEFKQAVTRYIKYTDAHCMQGPQRYVDDNVSYKKELRYLFKNYGDFSHTALLARIRSAHQEMVKVEIAESDVYKRYEQISSALLLTCAHVFLNDARNELLSALEEIDNVICYWRDQHHHQLDYFFHKSPIKWIMGKPQAKEITNNLIKLERKQRELYTILGSLTEHAHAFTETDVTYDDCYVWIEQLFAVLSCIKVSSNYSSDGTKFDAITAELGLKIKYVGSLKSDSLASMASAKQPNHFVRNWIAYTTILAATGYAVHYHSNNPKILPDAFKKTVSFAQGVVKSVVVDPMIDLYKVFFEIDSKSSVDNIELRIGKVDKLAEDVKANVAVLSKARAQSLRSYAEKILRDILERMNVANKDQILTDVANNNLDSLNKLCEATSFWHYDNRLDQEIVRILLLVDEILNILIPYLDLLDQNILPLTQEIGFLFVDLGHIVGDFIKNNFWTAKLAAFTPLAAACIGSAKTYQWAVKKNYSPIRIALADVNSLLIESFAQLDDYDYGKLVYLIYKLRHKAHSLKDPLSHEFLTDVAKLESKQYDPQIKRGIVENMFNKYAFLGRIAA